MCNDPKNIINKMSVKPNGAARNRGRRRETVGRERGRERKRKSYVLCAVEV